ncbi:hypothetical protein WS50_29625 [Burkholderia territorii]|nr:hypothetical protein WS47_00775 [Burkholderia territorii]KUZ05421.1 hypothetical protein WS50_29625 [Burkholderia territorii]
MRAWGFRFSANGEAVAPLAYGTITGSTQACTSVIGPTIIANSRLRRAVKRNSPDSLPTRPVVAHAAAIACGAHARAARLTGSSGAH